MSKCIGGLNFFDHPHVDAAEDDALLGVRQVAPALLVEELEDRLNRGWTFVGRSLEGTLALASLRWVASSLSFQIRISSSSASLTMVRQSRGQCEHASPTCTTALTPLALFLRASSSTACWSSPSPSFQICMLRGAVRNLGSPASPFGFFCLVFAMCVSAFWPS